MSLIRPLKLAALDEEDLKVLSAHVQDAVVKVGEIRWSATTGHFIVPMNRFAWEETQKPRSRKTNQRRQAVLQFDRVRKVSASGVSAREKDTVLSILAIAFTPGDPPSGTVTLACAGESTLRLEVECIEARLTDLGAAWSASMRPKHSLGNI
ncbi:MAG: DUF2948 family protein [Pseudomonadota bacterium]